LHQNREQFLEAKLEQLEKTLQLVLEQSAQSSKGKGRGKQSQPSRGQSFLSRFRPSQPAESQTSSSHSLHEEDEDDDDPPPPYQGTKRIYVKKVELLLNGSPLGEFHSIPAPYAKFILYSSTCNIKY